MTSQDFLDFYPQFRLLPPAVLEDTVQRANLRFDFLEEDAETARRLYTAHLLTLYAKTVPQGEADMASLSASGEDRGIIAKKVGDLSVSYSAGSGTEGTVLGKTVYGNQLRQLLRLTVSSTYVP